MARSGTAVAKLLAEKGYRVLASDAAANEETKKAEEALKRFGVEVCIGNHPLDRFRESVFAVISPGIPEGAPPVKALERDGIPIYSEIEVGGWYATAPIVAITGTNGKSTTVEMLGLLARSAGLPCRVCGNVGTPLSAVCQEVGPDGWLIVEVSSFQLAHIRSFRPRIAAILNITPDHMDRYRDYGDYIEDKKRILMNMRGDDILVYNADDPEVRQLAETHRGARFPFSLIEREEGIFPSGHSVKRRWRGREEVLFDRGDLSIIGDHNLQNAMAAAAMARLMGAHAAAIARAMRDFNGLEHRMERSGTIRGIEFINDSKATNPGSVRVALESFAGRIILIVGGKEKGLDYSSLAGEVSRRVKYLVGMGECGRRVAEEIGAGIPTEVVHGMREAVQAALRAAEAGDIVLLSPGTSSYDQYANFEERGKHFKAEVVRLAESES